MFSALFLLPYNLQMTIIELLKSSTEYLKSKGITNPKTSCEILLSHVLEMKRLDLYLNYDRKVTDAELERFKKLYKRRLTHEPLQYILGETEFMSLPFKVNAHVLIPRPETELLVEQVITFCNAKWSHQPVRILDIGTGCGNIAVSLAYNLPEAVVSGCDISPEAVELARENAVRNNVHQRVNFSVMDILKADSAKLEMPPGVSGEYSNLHVIVSNPPYVSTKEEHILEKEILDYEPYEALFAGEDGLIFFHTIARLAKNWLADGGLLAFETGYNTGEKVRDIVMDNSFHDVNLIKDYAGIDRIVTGIK